ncbi:MAG: translation initiation factor 2 subunit 1 [Candidatus Methanomethylophilaceae archaeon]|nr:translation initiation factor 2 subunit 1 [Candidatus Methanomethylophilaceae archaeon]
MARAQDYPESGELVVCTVKSVKNFGAFVSLDEYGDKEGFVHVRDVATGWVKYIRDYIREGQKIVCKVLEVDPDRGHIDLSLKSVNEHQRREKIQQWKNENKAEKLLGIVAERLGIDLEKAYEEFGYNIIEEYETLYGAFESIASAPEEFRRENKGDWVETLIEVAVENVTPPYVQIEAILELTNPASDGVEKVREALFKVKSEREDVKIKVQYVGAPRYRVVITADEYKKAEDVLKNVATQALNSITASGGEGSLKRTGKS